MAKSKVALILGAGFSCEAGLPSTRNIVADFVEPPINGLNPLIEMEISRQLTKFWKYVFNWNGGPNRPSLEDHFTVLDLAANSGRNIGPEYPPRKLRAIRRLSIHRIFQILNAKYVDSSSIEQLLLHLRSFALSVISTNWDIVVEKHFKKLGFDYSYGLPIEDLAGAKTAGRGIPLFALHGSANWIYCDSCRRLYVGKPQEGKAALRELIYITRDDFYQLCPENKDVQNLLEIAPRNAKYCAHCRNRLGARIATFSYRKEVSIPQFQTAWQGAFSALRDSSTWLFIGYSLPEADFEFRHLLKSAEKGVSRNKRRKIRVMLKDDLDAELRFKRFFGITEQQIHQHGLSACVNHCLPSFLPSGRRKGSSSE